jgi:hypothetical protein
MLGVDSDIGSSALRLWIAAGSAALLVFVCALAFQWARSRGVARIGVVVIGAILGATLAWAFIDTASNRDLFAERQALETRAAQLGTQALAPGSALACLDAFAGDSVESACEKAIFASPAATASAASYIAARLALLADIVAYTKRGGGHVDNILLPLRRSIETDRYGFAAHTLAVLDGCTPENCKALSLLHDASRVRANLSAQVLDRYLDHYAALWAQAPDTPVADATSAAPAVTNQPGTAGRKVTVDIDFPTAASIPPVSIMNPEPKNPGAAVASVTAGADTSVQATGAQTGAAPGAPAGSPKKTTRKQANQANSAPAPAPAPPQQIAPPSTSVDPVWSPGATLASPQGGAPAATAPSGATPSQ